VTGSLGEAGRASGEEAASETMRSLLAAAEPGRPRPRDELIERLESSGRLLAVQAGEPGGGRLQVHGVTSDSRQVRPGFVFVAVAGTHADGHDFVAAAAALGAAAAIVERPVAGAALTQIVVDDTR
jgi:UDP-N-acetylmuramyl tripeptide synthase